jgi:hypothetical protein
MEEKGQSVTADSVFDFGLSMRWGRMPAALQHEAPEQQSVVMTTHSAVEKHLR